jgi:hypothetical protein
VVAPAFPTGTFKVEKSEWKQDQPIKEFIPKGKIVKT